MNVQVTASTGEKYVQYLFGTGTNGSLSGGNAKVYLGYSAPSDWTRFERNVEADFEAYAGGGATWTNTDGLYITWPQALLSYAFYVDDIRLSNSLTVEHNTLGPGVIAHILRHTTWDSGTLAKTDRWFHYDQVGSVMSETNSGGTLQTTHHQDAFGNVQEAWASGLWDAGAGGWHHHSTELDADSHLSLANTGWMTGELGLRLAVSDPTRTREGSQGFPDGLSVGSARLAQRGLGSSGAIDAAIQKCRKKTPCRTGPTKESGDSCHSFVCCVVKEVTGGVPIGPPTPIGPAQPGAGDIVCYGAGECTPSAICDAAGPNPNPHTTWGGPPVHVGIVDSKGDLWECKKKIQKNTGIPPGGTSFW